MDAYTVIVTGVDAWRMLARDLMDALRVLTICERDRQAISLIDDEIYHAARFKPLLTGAICLLFGHDVRDISAICLFFRHSRTILVNFGSLPRPPPRG